MSTALTRLLSNDQLTRLERLRLVPRRRLTNIARGEHLRGRGGASIDFADFRNYVPGDDLRFVDWNIFARCHRPFLKVFLREEEQVCLLLVDVSASMQREGKVQRAAQLAAACATMALHAGERVAVAAIGGERRRLAPLRGRAQLGRVLAFLEELPPGGDQTPEAGIAAAVLDHRGRGLAVLCSDFLTFGPLIPAFNRLAGAGLEPWAFHVLGPADLDPDLAGDLRLVDCETAERLDVSSVADLLAIYQHHLSAFRAELSAACLGRGGRYLPVSAAEDLDHLLSDRLRRQGWVR